MSERVLSQDIKDGCLISCQTFHSLVGWSDEPGYKVEACAAGAALLGEGSCLPLDDVSLGAIQKIFKDSAKKVIDNYYPHLSKIKVDLPCELGSCTSIDLPRNRYIADAIEHLNDVCKWSREAIAEWLESLGY